MDEHTESTTDTSASGQLPRRFFRIGGQAVGRPYVRFTIADLIQLGVTVIAVVGLYFKLDAHIDKVDTKTTNLAAAVDKMDADGTHWSRERYPGILEKVNNAVAKNEEQEHTINEKDSRLGKVETNVLWLMARQLEKK